MASNDMNSWDEDPDKLLRQGWQRAFAEFEVQSRPSLRRRILSQVTTRNRPKPMGWLAGGVLLLLISAVLIYTTRRSDLPRSAQGPVTSVQPVFPAPSERVVAVRRPATPTRPATSSEQSEAGPGGNGVVPSQPLPDRQPVVFRAKTVAVEGSSRRSTWPTNRLRVRAEPNLLLADAYRTGRSIAKSTRYADTRFSSALPPSVGADHRERAKPLERNRGDSAGDSAVEAHVVASQPASPASSVVFARLDSPVLSALPSSLRTLPDRLPASESVVHPATDAENRARRHKQWFVEAVPLSSFQWMSTSSTSTAYITQVNTPAAFSPTTWGYQINGGIRWQRWQAHLSIGQLRRWAYYTVNENRYRMESSPTNPYQMVREKRVVAENVALPMVGGGLSQYRSLGQGRYMVELGSQVAYSPLDGQILASLRGGAGRRLPLSRRLELQAGLLVEYGLTRLMSEQQQLTIHPVVVGLSIRIQPRRQPQER